MGGLAGLHKIKQQSSEKTCENERIRLRNNNLIYLIWMRSVRWNRWGENPTENLDRQPHREISNHRGCPAWCLHAKERRDAQQLVSAPGIAGILQLSPFDFASCLGNRSRARPTLGKGSLHLYLNTGPRFTIFFLFRVPVLCLPQQAGGLHRLLAADSCYAAAEILF